MSGHLEKLTGRRWDLLVMVHASPGVSDETVTVYLARDLAPVPAGERHQRTHEEADLEVHAVPLDTAVDMIFQGEITNASTVAGLFAAARARDAGWTLVRPAG